MTIHSTSTTEPKGSFSGHETFPFRFAWLPRCVKHTAEDPTIFSRDDAMVRFGVGKNMVRSIRHWGLACGLLDEVEQSRGKELRVAEFGAKLFGANGWDPYLEDPATLWLLHWQLASKPRPATTWYWTFNHAPQLEFTRQELLGWLTAYVEANGWTRVAGMSLKRDIDTFLKTYVAARESARGRIEDTLDCPLVELALLRDVPGTGTYALTRSAQPSLPKEVFAFALLDRLSTSPGPATVPLDRIAFAPGSPGRVFGLTEDALLARLEGISALTKQAVVFDDTAGVRQLLVRARPDPMALLEKYYARANRSGQ